MNITDGIYKNLADATRKVNNASAAAYSGESATAFENYAEAARMFQEVQEAPEADETQREIAAEGLSKLLDSMARHASGTSRLVALRSESAGA